jgi:hypothetical protein
MVGQLDVGEPTICLKHGDDAVIDQVKPLF